MTDSQTPFAYLDNVKHSWQSGTAPRPCVICEQAIPGFPFVDEQSDGHDHHYVCEPCLIAGRLAEKNLVINGVDGHALLRQLRATRPDLGEPELRAIVIDRTVEVAQRTPRPDVFNTVDWPMHCGDYAVYYHKVDRKEVSRLAEAGDGKTFLATHLLFSGFGFDYRLSEEALENVWEDDLEGFLNFYLWKCRHCDAILFTYDSD